MKRCFLKNFSTLQNEKTHFWGVFHLYKMRKQVFEAFFIFTKWKNTFSKHFHLYKMKKHVFEAIFIFTKWKSKFLKRFSSSQNENTFSNHCSSLQNEKYTVFWSVFNLYKMKKQVFEAFFIFTNRKNKFSKRFFIFIKWKHVFQAFLGL